MDEKVKCCPSCDRWLPTTSFTRNINRRDGLDYECRDCKSIRFKRWRDDDPDYAKQRSRRWHDENRERSNQNGREWRKANPEKARDATRNWAMNNIEAVREIRRRDYRKRPEAYKAAASKRKAVLRSATVVPFTHEQLNLRMSMFGFSCVYCGGEFEHVEHAIPLARGGLHCLANLRPSCATCNLRKGTMTITEFLRNLPRCA